MTNAPHKPKPCYIVLNEAAAGIGLHVNAHKTEMYVL